jgi:F-type H+-transporting ATPase subunit delta
MSNARAAHRYALSLLEVATENKVLDKVTADLDFLQQTLKDTREFSLFLKSPVVKAQVKKRVVSEIFTHRVDDLTLKFLLLLITKDRETLIPEIVNQFLHLRDERMGIVDVSTRSAVELTDTQRKHLTQSLEQALKKTVRMSYVLDPLLKGGFTVQREDTVWDASVRRQLDVLRRRFINEVKSIK